MDLSMIINDFLGTKAPLENASVSQSVTKNVQLQYLAKIVKPKVLYDCTWFRKVP